MAALQQNSISPLSSAEQSRAEANLDGKKSYFMRIYPIRRYTEVTLNTNIRVCYRGPLNGPPRPISAYDLSMRQP
jgi:hypothetical protein